MWKLSTFLLFLLFVHNSEALKCYTCSVTEDDAVTTCESDPAAMKSEGITDCDKKYCIIVRVDYKDPRGKLASMVRTCVDKPTYLNDVIEDETHRAYYRSCRTDLCNDGSGRADNSNTERGSFGDKSTIYVPGIGTGGAGLAGISITAMVIGVIFNIYIR